MYAHNRVLSADTADYEKGFGYIATEMDLPAGDDIIARLQQFSNSSEVKTLLLEHGAIVFERNELPLPETRIQQPDILPVPTGLRRADFRSSHSAEILLAPIQDEATADILCSLDSVSISFTVLGAIKQFRKFILEHLPNKVATVRTTLNAPDLYKSSKNQDLIKDHDTLMATRLRDLPISLQSDPLLLQFYACQQIQTDCRAHIFALSWSEYSVAIFSPHLLRAQSLLDPEVQTQRTLRSVRVSSATT